MKAGRISQVYEGETVFVGAGLGLPPARYVVKAPTPPQVFAKYACLECRQTLGSRFARDLHTQVKGRHLFAVIIANEGVFQP